ncbi:YtxH domain-containing protein [Shewanella psychromarinicola]|uniref:YtxH domain-containing protein n=1 Tax=Shewanella psychromarinicola TaxID=2487742 RepID=A0A3N4EBC1_9GAMM|nr:YtxH domain-containing protein [Shewanella psychromarinicola]AZG36434.1 YtxH domain-containing protein [Shewanella psychromarinicola]MCL1084258.1 YtxH domain-containing protein [Shewanella psychromarinicola]RPA34278.1 YtxH domain-containing protein [Shewanella psychromarinicola]
MNNKHPYPPYYSYLQGEVKQASTYKQQNSKTHFAMGLAAGTAVAYLLSNKKFQQGVTSTGEKAWSAVRGEVEELKERLEDTQAELDYYRNLNKGEK